MPLIVLTGYPCSGLTYRANQLAAQLEATQDELYASGVFPDSKPRFKVHVVPTHDPSHPRTVYDQARTEKESRGVAYARAKRALGKDSFVILDGMNYIKGYRYQLWCEAKALKTSSCVVHVGTPIEQCVKNNEARIQRKAAEGVPTSPSEEEEATTTDAPTTDKEDPYPTDLLNNLIFRYEEPSIHSRWDKPLFTVPWSDASPPIAEIWTALTGLPHPSTASPEDQQQQHPRTSLLDLTTTSLTNTHLTNPETASIAPSTYTTATTTNGGGRTPLGRPRIRPHQATALPATTSSTALYSIEKTTSSIIAAIRAFTQAHPTADEALAASASASPSSSGRRDEGITIPIPASATPLFVPAHVARAGGPTEELAAAGGVLALPRLQRWRRQWITLNRAYVAGPHASARGGGLTSEEMPDAFVRFLNAEVGGVDT
ncbi:putative RNA polymerase II Elongator complex associated protein Kti12 [Aspergillus fijiensis CBS 313.89]|uniref:Chromatin associated protein KTI12 n=1 Tax=Aspergillus fijiensis CBS 313.89 TaxID=1448319 RepID=A0A8G1RGB2_9EURO|nr:chromatin associated protein KTI12 [Aspergillus fijiensis CBS 313.89]RAK72815.1 chromatin associated protein KTI12 [Aspergillus fijiensis CBS 313.89]